MSRVTNLVRQAVWRQVDEQVTNQVCRQVMIHVDEQMQGERISMQVCDKIWENVLKHLDM